MELIKAVVLKTMNYTDTQKIIQVYSLERGYLSLISPSALFKRKGYPVQTMQLTEIEFLESASSTLHKVRNIASSINLPALYTDIYKMNVIQLWGEILNLILKNEGRNDDLFHFITRSVEYLNSTDKDTGNFNLFFLYRLTGLIGFKINAASWQEDYVFNIADGSFYPEASNIPYISGPNTAKIIHRLCTCEVSEVRNIPLNRQARNTLMDVILLFYSTHLNIDFNVKSIRIIRQVFE